MAAIKVHGESTWTDYDPSSAYPTAMSLIGKADWRNVRVSMDLDDYTPARLGFACVDFKFPSTIRYPSLPIRTDNGLIFPLRGRSYCSTPEIDLARRLGAEMTIRFGVIVPTDHDTPVFRPFIVHALEQRATFKKGTLDSNFWKEPPVRLPRRRRDAAQGRWPGWRSLLRGTLRAGGHPGGICRRRVPPDVLRSTPVRRSISRWCSIAKQRRDRDPQMRLQDVHSCLPR